MQLATTSHVMTLYPSPMKAMERTARDPSIQSGTSRAANASAPTAKAAGEDAAFNQLLSQLKPADSAQSASAAAMDGKSVVSPVLSIASGALMGGPVGAAISVANVVFEAVTGDSAIGHIASLFGGAAETSAAHASSAYGKAQLLSPAP